MEITRSSVIVSLFVLLLLMEFSASNQYSNVSVIETERQALLNFKNTLTDPSNRLSSWVGEDFCTWRGVGCNQKAGHVVKLNLRNPYSFQTADWYDHPSNYSRSCLGGEINPSLLELKYLDHLDLSMNNFTGIQIPKFFGSLKKLRYLNLSRAGFEGMVPHHLGNLSSLRYLDLNGGSMPNVFQNLTIDNLKWVSHISSLRHLDLSEMYIVDATDWLYEINMLPNLLELRLSNCELPNISPLSYVNFTSLAILDLRWNRINSTIPRWLFNLSSLVYLSLAANHFHGPIPDAIGNMTSLTNLNLYFNEFEGEILKTVRNLCNLQSLMLSENKFSGEISVFLESSFGCLRKNLENLDLSYNEFSGLIPESLGQLSKLQVLGISSNALEGNVSELHFAKLRRLKVLRMSSNSLVWNVSSKWIPPFQLQTLSMRSCKLGPQFPPWLKTQRNISNLYMSNTSISVPIPDWFHDLSLHIVDLDLSSNQIRGNIQNFIKLGSRSMNKYLYLSNNLFMGHIPRSISNTTPELRELSLSGNHLIGSIPMSLCKMKNLESLDLSNNNLIGSIPMSLCKMKNLESLVLSNNNLTGSIPVSLCKMKNLGILDLSKNHLSGQLPGCWKHSMSLWWIDLSYNNLTGRIPSSMGSLQWVTALYLNNNNFYGQLPSTLKKWTLLIILDLSENGFYGKIPPWIGDSFSWLESFSLRSNKFDGNIPQQICHLANLRLLDLSHNNISGSIPRCFGNLSSMKWMGKFDTENLSSFRDHMFVITKGRELEYTSNLQFVISLDLSSNNMVGGIPKELTDLRGLHNLNISGNHLTGKIPEKIGDLESLECLDFSRNQFSGPIPPSMSALTFLSHLNLSFNNLSGPIPRGNQLQTLEDPSIYVGNPELCGRPLQKNCTSDYLPNVHLPVGGGKSNDEADILWFYVGLGPGFACGFLAFCGILLFKKTWRYAYFGFFDKINNRILVVVALAVKMAKLKKLHRDEAGA